MNTYLYRDKAGREIGPFDLVTLSKFRMAGVLDGDTPVRTADSGEWKPCREVIADSPQPTAAPIAKRTVNKSSSAILIALFAIVIVVIIATHSGVQHATEAEQAFRKQFGPHQEGINIINFKATSGQSFFVTNSLNSSVVESYKLNFETELEFKRNMTIEDGVDVRQGDRAKYAGTMIGSETDGGWSFGRCDLHVLSASSHSLVSGLKEVEKHREKIACVNQLKQIGIAFRLWEGDHGDQYPYNLSANAGGTKEFCSVGSDGFDKNAFLHFQVMSNELNTTKILVCPSDKIHPAIDFAHLRPENLSYQLHSGVNIRESNPSEILAVCPIHHIVVYCDGSVAQLPNEMWELALSNIRQAKAVSQANACINNLRQIDAAAQQWALEKGKTTGSPINFPSDLTPYIKLTADGKIPSCPAGGIYTINRVGDIPTCSFGTTVIPNHVLP